MRDPATRVDPKVEEALKDARSFLRCYVPLGIPPPDETNAAKRHREAFDYVQGSQHMPDPIRTHLRKLLDKEKRGERTRITANRNFWLALAVEMLRRDFGLNPTRTTLSKPEKKKTQSQSGSSIVKTALAELGLHLAERTIEDAWTDNQARLRFSFRELRKK